jgi:hypothetical protein
MEKHEDIGNSSVSGKSRCRLSELSQEKIGTLRDQTAQRWKF